MFNDIKSESTRRLIEVRESLQYIKNYEKRQRNNHASIAITSMKGLFFVHLYGIYEYTITSSISSCLTNISSQELKINELKPRLLSVVLDSDIESLTRIGKEKKWEKRWNFFDLFEGTQIVKFSNDILPTDGQNIRHRQLESIWKSFCITEDIFSRPEIGGRIKELVDFRNAIAHGNQTPSDIGKRFTATDLQKKFEDISEFCSYFIIVFEKYTNQKQFLK